MQKHGLEGSPEECEIDWLSEIRQKEREYEASYPDPGDGNAEAILADCFKQGRGVRQSDEQAACWYGKAGRQANVRAQIALAEMYLQKLVPMKRLFGNLREEDCESDYAELLHFEWVGHARERRRLALYWYAKAAEQGSKPAALAAAQLEPAVKRDRAMGTVEASATHFNFGPNVQARKRHYRELSEAIEALRAAGYAVRTEPGWGHRVETIH